MPFVGGWPFFWWEDRKWRREKLLERENPGKWGRLPSLIRNVLYPETLYPPGVMIRWPDWWVCVWRQTRASDHNSLLLLVFLSSSWTVFLFLSKKWVVFYLTWRCQIKYNFISIIFLKNSFHPPTNDIYWWVW